MMSRRLSNLMLIVLIVAAIVVAVALGSALLNFFSGPAPTPTPQVPPTIPVAGDPWQRIQATGKIVAGTSMDYPPFAFYNETFQPDGFDVNLIREIGQVLGLPVEIKDMAFDGLGGALQLGQIDVAIAAISVTPARESEVDFSNVYFVGEDAILANPNSPLTTVTDVSQLAGFRVGVQRATVYERWLRETLVDTNLMPVNNLLVYQQAAQAVEDVRSGRIDLVVLDLQPALTIVNQGGVKLVGQGLNQQRLAIAMINGAGTLQTQVNNALVQLQNSGRLNQLIQTYLGLRPDEVIPPPTPPTSLPVTATPYPTATAVPCINQMTFVQDLNLNDQNMTAPPEIQPGQPFRKWWRVRNSGTCTWDSSYSLVFVGGNTPLSQMSGQPTAVQGTVASGQTTDVFVDFIAPLTPGVYQSFWTMRSPQGQTFGDRIWAGIRVPAPATATPLPTQTPSASIQFTADRTTINSGECVNFNWNVQNATGVFFYARGENWQTNPVPPVSNGRKCPPVTTTYELRAQRADNTFEIREITISVLPVTGAPTIHRFTLSPTGQVNLGQCVTINWWVEGRITNVRLYRDNTVIWQSTPVNGSTSDCPPQAGVVTYRVEATGPGGTSNRTEVLNVIAPPPQSTPTFTPIPNTPTSIPPTPTITPPQILAFSVTPEQIETGNCVNISWTVGGGVAYVRLYRNGSVVVDNAPTSGAVPDCLSSAGTYTYRLEVIGQNGSAVNQERNAVVTNPSVEPPLAGTAWQLNYYYDGVGALVSLIEGTEITAVFSPDNQLNGSSGCNTYSANYTSNNGQLTISNVAGTQINCESPAGIMQQENQYRLLLPQASTYQRTSNELIIKDASGQIILNFRPALQPR